MRFLLVVVFLVGCTSTKQDVRIGGGYLGGEQLVKCHNDHLKGIYRQECEFLRENKKGP